MVNRVIEKPIALELKRIYIGKKSGELIIRGENFERVLYFLEGRLTFAKTNVLHERIGEILFKIGKINRSQFWDIHKLMEGREEKIGKVLVQNNFLSQKDLFLGLIFQLRSIILATFPLTSGEWEFNEMLPAIPEDSRFTIDLPSVFPEGVGKIKNLSLYKNQFLNKAPRCKTIPAELNEYLETTDVAFYNELANHSNMSMEQIFLKINKPEEEQWRKLMLLYLLNIVDFVDFAVDSEMSKNVEELIKLYDRMKKEELDYYVLFNLKNTASPNEIKEVYYKYAKKFHPDRLGNMPDPDLREKSNFVFARVNKAFDVLNNEDKKREYDSKGYKEISPQDKVSENLQEKANILYRKAKTLYNQKKFWEAATLLEEAVRYDGKGPYYLLLGLAQTNVPNLRRVSEKNLMKAIELEPWNAEPHVAVGLLFMAEKMEKRAESFFRKALSIDPDHSLARKRLEELTKTTEKKSLFSLFSKKK